MPLLEMLNTQLRAFDGPDLLVILPDRFGGFCWQALMENAVIDGVLELRSAKRGIGAVPEAIVSVETGA